MLSTKGPYLALVLSLGFFACSRSEVAETRSEPAPVAPAGAAREVLPVSSGKPLVVFLGDSLTAGLGLDPSESVPSLIQERMDSEGYAYEVVNAGVSGDTSAGGVRRLEWSLAGDVRVLVVELGGNDGLRGLPPEELKKNLSEIITAAQNRGIKVLLTGMEAPPNYGSAYTTEFRDVYRELSALPGVAFMPFFLEGVAGSAVLNQRDGVHPNAEGARIVERNVWRALQPLLEKRSTR